MKQRFGHDEGTKTYREAETYVPGFNNMEMIMHNFLRATETEKEFQERVNYAKDGPSKTIKQFRYPGGCACLVDWGSLAYSKAFRSMGIDARRSMVHKKFCCVNEVP